MIGKTIGNYEITSLLGKGGMGEVYQARDTRLKRDVAIKVLPDEFSRDHDRVSRFQREAEVLATLNHSNIAAIYDLHEAGGSRFLVLELVEGETLADRIKRGPLPIDEALNIAKQICEALEAAHEKGIIHRDLKPANIKITSDGKVKVLDFGLAKAMEASPSNAALSNSPTMSLAATNAGIILGTAAYMSPEQARGLAVDRRSDIWAFGCILYEMLTGRTTFEGEDAGEILASVIKGSVNLDALPDGIHPRLREVVSRCLRKDTRKRFRDIGDVRLELDEVLADPNGARTGVTDSTNSQTKPRRIGAWVLSGVFLGAFATSIAAWNLRTLPEAGPRSAVRFPFTLPVGQTFQNPGRSLVAVSPDGRHFVYNSTQGLYLRSLGELTARLIPGTGENLSNPFFSPDGQWVGYRSGVDSQLKKIAVNGGAPVPLATVTPLYGADWGSNGMILFDQPEGILSISENGGTPKLLVPAQTGEQVYGPELLPNGDTVLFTARRAFSTGRWDEAEIVAQSLVTGDRKVLVRGGSDARYVPTGHLVYAVGETLFATPFDLGRLEPIGAPVSVTQGVERALGPQANTGTAHYGFSDDGTLVYVEAGSSGLTAGDGILALVDRAGAKQHLNARPAPYVSPTVSPDGKRVAVQTTDSRGQSAIWVYDVLGSAPIRELTGEGNNSRPLWTPDSQRITFASDRDGPLSIYWQRVDGSGLVERITTAEAGTGHWPESWSPDGRTLVYAVSEQGNRAIWTLPLDGSRTPELFDDARGNQNSAAFSPNGKWIAYTSTESGEILADIYIKPFPPTGVKHRITQDGGAIPHWHRNGRELFYRRPNLAQNVIAVDFDTLSGLPAGNERTLNIEGFSFVLTTRDYDVMPDGDRFLMVFPADPSDVARASDRRIHVVLNWFEELKRLVPVP